MQTYIITIFQKYQANLQANKKDAFSKASFYFL